MLKQAVSLLQKTFKKWVEGHPLTYSAASAYFAVLSLPGFLVITIYSAAFFLDEQFVREQIQGYISDFLGENAADVYRK